MEAFGFLFVYRIVEADRKDHEGERRVIGSGHDSGRSGTLAPVSQQIVLTNVQRKIDMKTNEKYTDLCAIVSWLTCIY